LYTATVRLRVHSKLSSGLTELKASMVLRVLVHGQVTIIFVVSLCLSVCLFVCAEFFSAVFDPISIKLGHIICLGLVVSPRI